MRKDSATPEDNFIPKNPALFESVKEVNFLRKRIKIWKMIKFC